MLVKDIINELQEKEIVLSVNLKNINNHIFYSMKYKYNNINNKVIISTNEIYSASLINSINGTIDKIQTLRELDLSIKYYGSCIRG